MEWAERDKKRKRWEESEEEGEKRADRIVGELLLEVKKARNIGGLRPAELHLFRVLL